ncbi:curved DNA-binding protein [Ascoidea rubescens DSM 1968]|uniref:Curved DNA-binding protein n=1 Tax=Ascoidea rubescens DSM 1968 TaxID=1344418 RepID=A0A1D2VRP0_9ASCO|nr:curved DNA-binding protein [Ascoidea rubescens DSM 1968]ODV64260.1 curved DNA-binding protein [Ascoidea rubescens DSM 1968]
MTAATESDYTIANSDVVAKYRVAGDIATKVLSEIKKLCLPGAKIYEICVHGDELIDDEISKIYNSKKNKVDSKSIAFPVTISPNHIAAHLTPISSEDPSNLTLKKNDLIKIQLGAQVDGFASIVADSYVVGLDKNEKITGRNADVISAAYYATEAALRTIKEDKKNFDVTSIVSKTSKFFNCTPLEGMLSHNQQRNVLNGPKEIIINPSESQRSSVVPAKFEVGDVIGLDILVSTSTDGKVKPTDIRTTIYKLTGTSYSLKLRASHQVLGEMKKKASNFPFAIRNLSDPIKGKMGLIECTNHNVMTAYDIMTEKEGEIIAQFYTTVALTKNGLVKLASSNFDISTVQSENKITDDELLKLLSTPLKTNKKKKSKAKKASSAAEKPAATSVPATKAPPAPAPAPATKTAK